MEIWKETKGDLSFHKLVTYFSLVHPAMVSLGAHETRRRPDAVTRRPQTPRAGPVDYVKPLLLPHHVTRKSAMITGRIGQHMEARLYAWINLELGVACYVAAIAVQDGLSYADFTPAP